MARVSNDGRGRLGGRRPGSKNKPKATAGTWAAELYQLNKKLILDTWSGADTNTQAAVFAVLAAAAEIGRLADAVEALASNKAPVAE